MKEKVPGLAEVTGCRVLGVMSLWQLLTESLPLPAYSQALVPLLRPQALWVVMDAAIGNPS